MLNEWLCRIGFPNRHHMKPKGLLIFHRLEIAKTLINFLLIIRQMPKAFFHSPAIEWLDAPNQNVIPKWCSQDTPPKTICPSNIPYALKYRFWLTQNIWLVLIGYSPYIIMTLQSIESFTWIRPTKQRKNASIHFSMSRSDHAYQLRLSNHLTAICRLLWCTTRCCPMD